MATHEQPGRSNKRLVDCLCSTTQRQSALKIVEFLSKFPDLHVPWVQYPADEKYTCWYVTFKDHEEPFMLHFTIKSNGTDIEFRYPDYLPHESKSKFKKNQNWLYARFDDFRTDEIEQIVINYMVGIKAAFLRDELVYRKHRFTHLHLK